jgi:hypothetical protein
MMMYKFVLLLLVRNVISGSSNRETDPIRALIGGACRVWQWPPLTQRHNKRGQAGARETTFAVPTVPPQTLTT